MTNPRLPGRTATRIGPDQATDALEWYRSRRSAIANREGWAVGTLNNPYWPGRYQLSERPVNQDVGHVYALPLQKFDRDYTVSCVRIYNNTAAAGAATLTVAVYEQVGRQNGQLRVAVDIDMTQTGQVSQKLPFEFTFQKDRQYAIATLFTGTINGTGPQPAILRVDAPPLVAAQEISRSGELPQTVKLGNPRSDEVHEFVALVFLNDQAETILGAGATEGMASYGSMYISSASATTITTSGTPEKAAGTTTAGDLKDFTMPTDNRLQYTGASTKEIEVNVFTSTQKGDAGTKWVDLYLAKNSVAISETKMRRQHSSASDLGVAGIAWIVSMDPDDYVEFWLDREDNGQTVTVNQMTFIVRD
jgi:hypothetical protein